MPGGWPCRQRGPAAAGAPGGTAGDASAELGLKGRPGESVSAAASPAMQVNGLGTGLCRAASARLQVAGHPSPGERKATRGRRWPEAASAPGDGDSPSRCSLPAWRDEPGCCLRPAPGDERAQGSERPAAGRRRRRQRRAARALEGVAVPGCAPRATMAADQCRQAAGEAPAPVLARCCRSPEPLNTRRRPAPSPATSGHREAPISAG